VAKVPFRLSGYRLRSFQEIKLMFLFDLTEQVSKGRLSNRLKSTSCNISGMVGTRIVIGLVFHIIVF